ncbi:MAG: amidohydrolase [Bacteroidales bacterium]|nr:amidohydrolase [Bacteroidales bacterium]
MTQIKNMIRQLSKKYLPEIIQIRRDLHAYPELSMQEFKTSGYIASFLTDLNIPLRRGIAKTGLTGLIEGKNPLSKVIGLRADMDALPIQELNDVPYKSTVNGVMHACGHDVHMASLLGAAKILNELKDDFEGSVKLIFQPSEEKYPGGAIRMIEEGVLEDPVVEKMYGLHVFPALQTGKVGMKEGKYMASTDELFFTVKGRGGHGATPDLNIDPVVIAAHIILALQQIVSRHANPVNPTVLSIGHVLADGKTNIIPDYVRMEGVLRTFDENWRKEVKQKISRLVNSIAESMGGTCDVSVAKGYPYLVNDIETTKKVRQYAEEYLGLENVEELEMRMTSEDFAYFSQKVPVCFYRLGIKNEAKGITANLHSPTFNVDENSLETGMGMMAWIAAKELSL